jgi:glutathione peroxidase
MSRFRDMGFFISAPSFIYPDCMSTLFDIPIQTITGESTSLEPYRGHVVLVVNVASKCGLTPQYEALEKLYGTYKHRGFDILGFPANDFAGQEPGTEQEIMKFCTLSYNVTFPMFSKITVTGEHIHPLYAALVEAQPVARVNNPGFRANLDSFLLQFNKKTNPPPSLLWNFEKFLINRDGKVVARFSPDTLPTDPVIIDSIERELPPL